ncbi:YsnF/AvaK domain-containing protein [Chitinispirillales bacterium ANBcel5]|uniref:YsnF/AvaK domain-containing protein n=1 Tax=Cellulosispirillum alkaliphilum TaxID=3039283 RepID=UPI002A5866F8|nr:YsnF/AvaK domain-containing protein [Chitinispirillales bacterium ANBcel5]
MLKKKQFLEKYPGAKEGLNAYTQDGEKLGKIIELNDDYLTIEKGFFFPKDFTFRYDDVMEIKESDCIINQKQTELSEWKEKDYKGWTDYEKTNELTVPVKEEELEAVKVARQKGEVRVRKVVHTEMKNFTVPVSKEEVIVERKPVSDETQQLKPEDREFKEGETRIPVREEEVEIRKRPKVKEELKIHKEAHTEEKKVSGEVKKEDVKVEGEDKGKRKAA